MIKANEFIKAVGLEAAREMLEAGFSSTNGILSVAFSDCELSVDAKELRDMIESHDVYEKFTITMFSKFHFMISYCQENNLDYNNIDHYMMAEDEYRRISFNVISCQGGQDND